MLVRLRIETLSFSCSLCIIQHVGENVVIMDPLPNTADSCAKRKESEGDRRGGGMAAAVFLLEAIVEQESLLSDREEGNRE